MTKEKMKLNLRTLNTYLVVILVVVLLFSVFTIVQLGKEFKKIEPPKPPKISLLTVTIVTPPECADCFDADAFVAAVRQTPLTNVTDVRVSLESEEGKQLIKDYKLARLPAAIVTGETENVTVNGFTKVGGAYAFTETPPPYYDVARRNVVGRVKITYVTDAGCPLCFDVAQFGDQLKQIGVSITSERTVDMNDKEGREFIAKYKIIKVPTMVMSEDALAYDIVSQVWPQVGSQESDSMLVMRNVSPPYRDLNTHMVSGLVTMTSLVDGSCAECYNVSMHKQVLEQSFAMKFKDIRVVDVTGVQGKALVQKYNVTYVPTFLLDKEAAAYASLPPAWESVGYRHDDGTFVFQNVNLLAGVAYKNIATGAVMNATEQ